MEQGVFLFLGWNLIRSNPLATAHKQLIGLGACETHRMTTDLIPAIDLRFLAREINDAHRHAALHAKGMLLEATRAGNALLDAKAQRRHGTFKSWVEANCGPYAKFAPYMQVAKLAALKNLHLQTFDGGIRAFLDAHAEHREKPAAAPSFTRDDAEYALKIAALAERGIDGEQAPAKKKLDGLAKGFGMSAEEEGSPPPQTAQGLTTAPLRCHGQPHRRGTTGAQAGAGSHGRGTARTYAALLAISSLIRCTVRVPSPSVRAVLRMPVPFVREARTRCSTAGATFGRPSFFPCALALASPALTRSRIMARSNCANTPSI
jgi:hypothetical protein